MINEFRAAIRPGSLPLNEAALLDCNQARKSYIDIMATFLELETYYHYKNSRVEEVTDNVWEEDIRMEKLLMLLMDTV